MDSVTLTASSQNPSTQGYSISRLPPEMFRDILQRVPAHHLIRLRSVSNGWKSISEDICRDKKSLVVWKFGHNDYRCISELSNSFNGHLKLSHNVVFILLKSNQIGSKLSANLCTILSNFFPQIEQFFTNVEFLYSSPEFISMLQQWSSTLTALSLPNQIDDILCAQINNLPNLKRLHLDKFDPEIAAQLARTLNQVEHFSFSGYELIVHLKASIVRLLGPKLTSLRLPSPSLSIDEIINWRNAQFASTLERLCFVTMDPQVFWFICKHFSSLQMLRIKTINKSDDFRSPFKFTTDTIEHLARLTHLTELRFDSFVIDLANFDLAKLRPLSNIRILSFVDFTFEPGNLYAYRFCRVLSTIFPNVNKLTIKSRFYIILEDSLELHLKLFTNLRSHDFSLDDPIDRLLDY